MYLRKINTFINFNCFIVERCHADSGVETTPVKQRCLTNGEGGGGDGGDDGGGGDGGGDE